MSIKTTYSEARANLASLLKQVTSDRETVIIARRGGPSVAMIAADDLESLLETAYLLRSPRNARRLLKALDRAVKHEGKPQTIASLRQEIGLDGNQ